MNTPDCTRRDFVKGLSAATLGALADTVIVLWMGGGMAAAETFDPKRYTPFEKGMNPNTVLSTFPSIPTGSGWHPLQRRAAETGEVGRPRHADPQLSAATRRATLD